MDPLMIIENTVSYIEKNLEKPLSISEIAHQSGYSEYYFQHLFSAVCKVSVGEYIRCRKMTLAADDLLNSSIKIIDAAYKYGYETPESFTKAFNRYHGISPSKLRQQGQSIKKFSRIYPAANMENKLELNVELKKLPAFHLTGINAQFPLTESIFRDDIPNFWNQCQKDNTIHSLFLSSNSNQPFKGIAACCMDAGNDSMMNYMIGVSHHGIKQQYTALLTIPELKWLTFKGTGRLPQVIQQAWHQIYTDFFPVSEFIPYGTYDLEIYPTYEMNTASYSFEIWVPVKEREKE